MKFIVSATNFYRFLQSIKADGGHITEVYRVGKTLNINTSKGKTFDLSGLEFVHDDRFETFILASCNWDHVRDLLRNVSDQPVHIDLTHSRILITFEY